MNNTDIKLVSVVIPVYNEEASLPVLLSRVTAACDQLSQDYEVILIDDGSHDGSTELISEAAAIDGSKLVGVLLNRNYGQHAAIMAGFETAKGDLVITLDADLQNPPEEIPRLVEAAMQGYDVVGTMRRNRQDSWFRKTASKLINKSVQKATGVHMSDYGCMLRAYRRHIIDAMLCCQERSTFIPILANSFARRTIELEVGHAERAHGESKYGLMHLINLMYDLVTCMTTTPLRLLSIVGSVVAGIGFTFSILLILMRLILGADWAADGVFTLFAILFTFVGVQLLGMGLLGEYIGRMYTDVRARPRYFIHRIVRTATTPSQQEAEQ
ncbi:TPA: undecaprenyl-phosphate 4-deoxy-4-formamido-L-arabinose transferase [Aeromonas dhakensis]|uniref:undecaprenyl-phosphate 4-deoxy-4-formamido-L-arabinose transferase n=1 Tax=Aeromonas TaxID=642 RepID=UPI00036161C0|nr:MULTISPECIES: undecaprenyl-phosphate 4-deoxy-4-formamido-L-arabinose transferase [Aeromonas]QXA17319.1 undecaprenyl-phosphate 4-deoxy-4-formamido-L-arabinose transferase [Aeromonas sp. FDAARGOS 1403]RFS25399.1 undecaprenyl-phosphate 4-deoxy-4-formamido-L-arabinose transferase [Aeromonas dhakensis]UNU88995.1 undecaprenyl-phosphate 4-deoxy-4-formamido-L-arabinose transferase [Aeromonas dhakensis]HDX8352097.1 undecaprenyl-phosphate 4-deoxy-4-formamido-L-arabinose transferase [Aeromonas dhakensi